MKAATAYKVEHYIDNEVKSSINNSVLAGGISPFRDVLSWLAPE